MWVAFAAFSSTAISVSGPRGLVAAVVSECCQCVSGPRVDCPSETDALVFPRRLRDGCSTGFGAHLIDAGCPVEDRSYLCNDHRQVDYANPWHRGKQSGLAFGCRSRASLMAVSSSVIAASSARTCSVVAWMIAASAGGGIDSVGAGALRSRSYNS